MLIIPSCPGGPFSQRLIACALLTLLPSLTQACDPSRKAHPTPEAIRQIEVNRASREDLRSIPGIGPARAQRILAERAHGPFRDLADLSARVPGLGQITARQLTRHGLRVTQP